MCSVLRGERSTTSPGEYRNDQSPILTLAEIDPLRVEVFVPTLFHGQIKLGSVATVTPEPPIEGQFAATTTVVDRVMDAASGTFGVRLRLPNPNFALPSGVRCFMARHRSSSSCLASMISRICPAPRN